MKGWGCGIGKVLLGEDDEGMGRRINGKDDRNVRLKVRVGNGVVSGMEILRMDVWITSRLLHQMRKCNTRSRDNFGWRPYKKNKTRRHHKRNDSNEKRHHSRPVILITFSLS